MIHHRLRHHYRQLENRLSYHPAPPPSPQPRISSQCERLIGEEDVAPTSKPVPPPTPAVPDADVPVVPAVTHDAPPPPPLSVEYRCIRDSGSTKTTRCGNCFCMPLPAVPFCAARDSADRTCTASASPVDSGFAEEVIVKSPFTKTTTRLFWRLDPIAISAVPVRAKEEN